MDEPTLTYLYQYVGSVLVMAFGFWVAHRAGTLTKRWAAIMVLGLLAYALGHGYLQLVAPST